MKLQNHQIAQDVAERLLAAEEAIDEALNKTANLVGFIPIARREARVSCEVGQDAIEHIVRTISMLSEARKSIVESHGALDRTHTAARLAPRNYGGFVDKPASASATLTVVGRSRSA